MTQTISTPSSNPDPKSGTRHPAPCASLARHAIRRLQVDLAERLTPSWDPALDPKDADLPELLEAAMSPSGSAALDALNTSPNAQNVSPEEFDAIADAGGDPAATAANGTSHPRILLPASKLIPLLRLAASIGSLKHRDAMLVPGAITVIEGIPNDLVDALKKLLPHALPTGWSLAMSMGRLPRDTPYLLVLGPELMNGKISEHAGRGLPQSWQAPSTCGSRS